MCQHLPQDTQSASTLYREPWRLEEIELRPLRDRFTKLEELEHSLAWCDFHTCVDVRVNSPFDEQINECYEKCRPCEECEFLYCESCIDHFKEDAYCARCGEWRCPECSEDWVDGQFFCEGGGCRFGYHAYARWNCDTPLCASCKVSHEHTKASPFKADDDGDRVFDMCPECFGMYETAIIDARGGIS